PPLLVRIAGIEAAGRAGRIVTDAVARALGEGVGTVPVGRPLPHVAGHVVEPVAVGREGPDRRRAREAIVRGLVIREVSRERFRRVAPAWTEVVTPRVALPFQSPARAVLPFRLRGQALARPLRVRFRVVPRHLDDRVVLASAEVTAGTLGMLPARTGCP